MGENLTAQRIRQGRRSLNLTQEKFAEKCDVNRVTVSSWENGKYAPEGDTLQRVASALGVSTDYLMGRETSAKKEALSAESNISGQRLNRDNVILVPVISPILKCSAGNGNGYDDSGVAWDVVSQYPLFDGTLSALYSSKSLSAMYAEGDSMEPQIHDGDLIVFVHDETWIPGNIAIVRLDGKLFVKGILRSKNGYILRSQNRDYADIEVGEDDDFSVVGRVVKIITDRDPKPVL